MKLTNKRGTNGYAIKPKYRFWSSIWFVAFLTATSVIVSLKTQPKIISPCPANGCHSWTTVEAAPPAVGTKATIIAYTYEVFSKSGHAVALRAIRCFDSESKFDAMATHVNKNGSVDRGISQINSYAHPTMTDPYNYVKNINYAYKLFLQRGWQPWFAAGCR